MRSFLNILSWIGLVVLGLANGLLEDILFIYIMVPYVPPGWDLTGDLFWVFTVPLAQLMALSITGTLAWLFLSLKHLPRLITFWASWSVARATILTLFNNPVEDVLVYLMWIALWCVLIGLLTRLARTGEPVHEG